MVNISFVECTVKINRKVVETLPTKAFAESIVCEWCEYFQNGDRSFQD